MPSPASRQSKHPPHLIGTADGTDISAIPGSGVPAFRRFGVPGVWGLDQLGNWSDFQEDANGDNDFTDAGDLDQDRTHNDANEITGITEGGGQSAWVDASYDLAGNMTEGPAPGGAGAETSKHKYVYDAWNRLVKVTDASDVTIATYEYDGLNRRIAKTDELADPDVDYDYYYDESWRVVEVRKDADTDPLHQYVWQPPAVYIDALAIDYYDADTDGSDIDELYASFDANMNVTALIDDGGTVLERYEYDAYGQPRVLDADFSSDGDGLSDYENEVLFGGYRYDPESGLYHVRNRMLHPILGRWMQRDPAGYVDGGSLYEYLGSRPPLGTDASGLAWKSVLKYARPLNGHDTTHKPDWHDVHPDEPTKNKYRYYIWDFDWSTLILTTGYGRMFAIGLTVATDSQLKWKKDEAVSNRDAPSKSYATFTDLIGFIPVWNFLTLDAPGPTMDVYCNDWGEMQISNQPTKATHSVATDGQEFQLWWDVVVTGVGSKELTVSTNLGAAARDEAPIGLSASVGGFGISFTPSSEELYGLSRVVEMKWVCECTLCDGPGCEH